MSAYIVDRERIDQLVRLAIHGPTGEREVRPDNAWRRVDWYTTAPRPYVANAVDHVDYFRKLEEIRHSARIETANETARMLITANVESVAYRYSDDSPDTLPGPRPAYWTDLDSYRVRLMQARPTAVAGLKMIDNYEYQSCEHPGWEDSEAARFCDALRSRLISALPGYDEAAW
jgi:hypothetical protein